MAESTKDVTGVVGFLAWSKVSRVLDFQFKGILEKMSHCLSLKDSANSLGDGKPSF
jgi:hypothetical protein